MTIPSLSDQALALLQQNINQQTFSSNETNTSRNKHSVLPAKNEKWSFSTPCSSARQVQESTSTLLAARALAKAGNVTLAWESLRSLVTGQRDDGFIPKYRYLQYTEDDSSSGGGGGGGDEYYINHTTIPGPRLGSYLSALPLHASVVLDVFAWSEQGDEDLEHLVELYVSIYRYHHYMVKNRPTYNVWHPWETLWDAHSWIDPLGAVRRQIQELKWKIPFDIPMQVLQSYDYLPEVYEPCIYLLECYANSTKNESATSDCPPLRIQAVEYAAIWVEANSDLIEMYRVIKDRHLGYLLPLSAMDLEQPTIWLAVVQDQLETLWDDSQETFLPKQNENTTLIVPDASNFVGLWSNSINVSHVFKLTSKLMQRDDNRYSFDCGKYAVWSRGGCSSTSTISPVLNYFISTGLHRNDVHGIGYYIGNATTNHLFPYNTLVDFPIALNATTGLPIPNLGSVGTCEQQFTTTAAVVYDLVTPTPPRIFYPDPPIRNSGIIVLIIVEVVVAFAIGASCLFLNLKMVRESSRLAEDEQQGEDGYFSAAGSIGGDYPYEIQNETSEAERDVLINPSTSTS